MSVRSVCILSVCGLSGSVCVRACLECGMCQVCVWHVCARAVWRTGKRWKLNKGGSVGGRELVEGGIKAGCGGQWECGNMRR